MRRLVAEDWDCATEVTFNVYGERGSMDLLAFHAQTSALLVVEVKTVVPDVGGMIASLDRKARLGARVARERRWRARHVSRLLVIREGPTARRHITRMASLFGATFPVRGVAVRHWLKAPTGAIAGLVFFSIARRTSGIKRVRRTARPAPHDRAAATSQMHATW